MDRHISHRPQFALKMIGIIIGGFIFAMTMALLFGIVVKWLWNWLMPPIFGLTTITFWQAWGLVVLSHILFKSFPHHKPDSHHGNLKKKIREHIPYERCDEPGEESKVAE